MVSRGASVASNEGNQRGGEIRVFETASTALAMIGAGRDSRVY